MLSVLIHSVKAVYDHQEMEIVWNIFCHHGYSNRQIVQVLRPPTMVTPPRREDHSLLQLKDTAGETYWAIAGREGGSSIYLPLRWGLESPLTVLMERSPQTKFGCT